MFGILRFLCILIFTNKTTLLNGSKIINKYKKAQISIGLLAMLKKMSINHKKSYMKTIYHDR